MMDGDTGSLLPGSHSNGYIYRSYALARLQRAPCCKSATSSRRLLEVLGKDLGQALKCISNVFCLVLSKITWLYSSSDPTLNVIS